VHARWARSLCFKPTVAPARCAWQSFRVTPFNRRTRTGTKAFLASSATCAATGSACSTRHRRVFCRPVEYDRRGALVVGPTGEIGFGEQFEIIDTHVDEKAEPAL